MAITKLSVSFLFAALVYCGHCAESFNIVTYNVENYVIEQPTERPIKPQAARQKVWESILAAKPDVLALQEVGSTNALLEIQNALSERALKLPYTEFINGFDANIHLAILSRFPLDERHPHTSDEYLLNNERLHVSRGFAQVDVSVNSNYSFTMLVAHLKSKRPVNFADQSDMRLEEAKILRRKIDACFADDKNVNLVVLGDLNDLKDSKPVRTVIGRGNMGLTDTRPFERHEDAVKPGGDRKHALRSESWTHFYEKEDVWSRIDYILLSRGMEHEWLPEKSFIAVVPEWGLASDHRPVVACFTPEDR